jgi:hypothetical protein
MSEISKLEARLRNVMSNVTEYKMTIKEANALLSEIKVIEAQKISTQVATNPSKVPNVLHNLDAGSIL